MKIWQPFIADREYNGEWVPMDDFALRNEIQPPGERIGPQYPYGPMGRWSFETPAVATERTWRN